MQGVKEQGSACRLRTGPAELAGSGRPEAEGRGPRAASAAPGALLALLHLVLSEAPGGGQGGLVISFHCYVSEHTGRA